jgi:hypothetical protein
MSAVLEMLDGLKPESSTSLVLLGKTEMIRLTLHE